MKNYYNNNNNSYNNDDDDNDINSKKINICIVMCLISCGTVYR